ncbi:MAG TPA: FtsX-like permease family protein [Thermoanaerobaculia bacterium]|jgi:predicted permease
MERCDGRISKPLRTSSARGKGRRPALDLLIVVSLALGIGAMSTVGGIVHAVLLRALPFSSPERLVVLGEAAASRPDIWKSSSYPDFLDWASQVQGFESMAISRPWGPVLRLPAASVRISGAEVSADFLSLLGVRPALGRLLGPADFRPGAEPAVVLSHRVWSQRFGADAGLVGRTISLDGAASTVVGILPEAVALDEPVVSGSVDLLKPLIVPPGSPFAGRGFRAMRVLARLREGVSGAQAATELRQMGQRLATAHPETNQDIRIRVEPLREVALAGSRPILLALLGAAALLLLLACVNAANLRLVELSSRRQNFAVRVALGADRAKLFRQLLGESLPLAGTAFLLGLLLTRWAWNTFVALLPANPATDARILAAFALTGLVLAVIGVYGVTSFTVSRKRQELGVRIALGAEHRDVVRTVLAQGTPWVVLGLLLGLGGGAFLSRLLASTLFEISPLDPWTFAVTPVLLLAVALWASYVPVRRAALLDPLRALTES